MQSASEIIAALGLEPHPEGGFYRETFRDDGVAGARAASTAIYFLLPHGVVSRWHRVDAAEVWHWYAGSALALSIAAPAGVCETLRLGNDLTNGERPQAVVPAGHWQQAESLGAWTLVGCTVAPGFSFDGFEIAAEGFDPSRH
jgi:uncharacterized protein